MTTIASPAAAGATPLPASQVLPQPPVVHAPGIADKLPVPASDVSQPTAAPAAPAEPDAAQNAGNQDQTAKDTPTTEDKPKPPSRFQQRIDDLTRRAHEAERTARAAVNEANAAKTRLAELAKRVDPNDLSQVEAFRVREAITMDRVESAQNAAQGHVQERDAALAEANRARQDAFFASVADARARIPNLDMSLQQFSRFECSHPMADVLATSDRAGELIHHFMSTPHGQEQYAQLNALPPHLLGREIARIEGRITAQPMKRISQAPAPVQTVAGAPGAAGFDPATASNEDYRKWRASQS